MNAASLEVTVAGLREVLAPLIAKLKEATGPSRELDVEIARMMGLPYGPLEEVLDSGKTIHVMDECAPAFTASIDAALTLVPEGWQWNVSGPDPVDGNADKGGYAILVGPWNDAPEPWNQERVVSETDAQTPAIALVIAALKALSGLADNSESTETG